LEEQSDQINKAFMTDNGKMVRHMDLFNALTKKEAIFSLNIKMGIGKNLFNE